MVSKITEMDSNKPLTGDAGTDRQTDRQTTDRRQTDRQTMLMLA